MGEQTTTEVAGGSDDGARDDRKSSWQAAVPTGHVVTLPPDPHIFDAMGGNHRLETAVADLVDNSIDAGATSVLIRFVIAEGRVQTLYVVDDGHGMSKRHIDRAMTMGASREYDANALGHFGLGMKAASFSQADSLTVLSYTDEEGAVGRRWTVGQVNKTFECDILGYGFSNQELGRTWGYLVPRPGTVVRWDSIRSFPSSTAGGVAARFVQDASARLQQHLGLVFHRFLQAGRIRIGIDSEDVDLGGTGPVLEVTPLDPFGYPRSGATGYPMEITASPLGHLLTVVCHVWAARSQLPQFRLPDERSDRHQGFYFYRRNRLLQVGGWNTVEVARRELQLARVVVDLSDAVIEAGVVRLNPEKSRVECSHEFVTALNAARGENRVSFADYLAAAAQALKQSNRRSTARKPTMPLGRGVPRSVRDVVRQELDALPGYSDVDIRWRNFDDNSFFRIDRETNSIWLNSTYRKVIAGDGPGSLNDAPVVKLLIFLLTENLFHGSWLGAKDKDNLELWGTLLTAAAKAQLDD